MVSNATFVKKRDEGGLYFLAKHVMKFIILGNDVCLYHLVVGYLISNYIGLEWPKIVPWLGTLVWYQERLPRYLNIGTSMSLYYNKPHKRKWKYIYRTNKQWPQSLFNCNNSSTKLHVLTLARFICAKLFWATNVVVFGPFFD